MVIMFQKSHSLSGLKSMSIRIFDFTEGLYAKHPDKNQ